MVVMRVVQMVVMMVYSKAGVMVVKTVDLKVYPKAV